jgi:hypothetical protein
MMPLRPALRRFRADVGGVVTGARLRVGYAVESVRRTTAPAALLRTAVGVTGFTALLVALPADSATPTGVGVLVLVAALLALLPRTRLVGLVISVTIIAWLIRTLTDPQTPLWRLLVIMAAAYLLHTGAALAAVLPHDALTPIGVLVRWLARSGMVIAISLALAIAVFVAGGLLTEAPGALVPLLGLTVAVALAGLLAWLLRSGATR